MTGTTPRIPRLALTCFACLAALAPAGAGEQLTTAIGDGVRTIRLSGADTELTLVSSDTTGRQVQITTSDSAGCRLTAAISEAADTLTVRFDHSGSWMRWWCDPKVSVVMPSSLNLSVELDRLVAGIGGRFRDIAIRSAKSVIRFHGRAEHFQFTAPWPWRC